LFLIIDRLLQLLHLQPFKDLPPDLS
jgi:hypothetical protein